MSESLARATIDARLASTHERRQGRQIEDERRAERRRDRRFTLARWWWGRASRRPDVAARTLTAAATPVRPPSVRLAQVLEDAAHNLAQHGTSSERRLLEAMSEVAAQSAPGAAAALVHPDGTAASRLRAFGLLHTHLLEALGPHEHAWLLDLLDDEDGLERSGRVA